MTDPVRTPMRIPTLTRIVKIASGYHHLVMLTDEGNVLTMGCGENGQLGRVAERFSTRAGSRNWQRALMRPAIVPIKMASRLADRGGSGGGGNSGAAGGSTSLSLHSASDLDKSRDSSLSSSSSSPSPSPSPLSSSVHGRSVTDIWAGGYASVVKLESGAVLGFGLNSSSQLGFRSVGASAEECCVFRPEYLADISALDPVSVSCGHHHTLVLAGRDGNVYACGSKAYGACGIGVAPTDENDDKDAGVDVVVAPTKVSVLENVRVASVAAGIYTSYAVAAEDGALWSWGTGTNNALGHGDERDYFSPAKVVSKQMETRRVTVVTAGGQHCALLAADDDGCKVEDEKTGDGA